ncbi:hypothetical protein QYF36_003123 [Acer negundo]|nr:hypothetical protein QYF36_003123 [Acer negundo]
MICSNRTASMSQRQNFISNFLATMDAVTPLIATQRYATVVNGTGNTTVYTFGECMKDLSRNDCNFCFAQCKTQILRCFPFQLATRGGRLFFDGCYLRYDDYDFFNETLSSNDTTVCGKTEFGSGNKTVFGENAIELVRNLSVEAVKNDGFFVGSVSRSDVSVFGLAQCWEPVTLMNVSACQDCLLNAVSRIGSCIPMEEGRALNAGCYLRYSTQRFYNNSSDPVPVNGGGSNKLPIILGTTSAAAFLLIVGGVVFFVKTKILQKRRERKQLGSLLAHVNKSKLNFSYETLEKATNYFHNSNKLGQGGSGSVFKGILPDGNVVAIKRLFFNTRQWVDHFFNEVNLISGIDHKNLVKLLGCSITGPESLLVYEFMPNQSLHEWLFARNDVEPLRWEMRYDIILAKIADFGLARLLPEDQTHISTAIAGTLGYMAPEYVVRGKLTEKVWDLYGRKRLHEAVDPVLQSNFREEEASRLFQIGLLCVQASAELRPSMSMVVKMLKDNHEIPEPTQPPFLNPSSKETSIMTTSATNNSKPVSYSQSSGNSLTQSWIDPR